MIAKTDTYVEQAVSTVYKLTQDEKIRQQCEAREDYRRGAGAREKKLKDAQNQLKQKEKELKQKDIELEQELKLNQALELLKQMQEQIDQMQS